MEISPLEMAIKKKAEARVAELYLEAIRLVNTNPFLSRLKIYRDKENRVSNFFRLASDNYHLPNNDLLTNWNTGLLEESTNFEQLKDSLTKEIEQSEVKLLMDNLSFIKDYIERNGDFEKGE